MLDSAAVYLDGKTLQSGRATKLAALGLEIACSSLCSK